MSKDNVDACSVEKVAEPIPAGGALYDGTVRFRPLLEVGKDGFRISLDSRTGENGSALIDGAESNDAAMKIDTSIQHGFLLWVCEQ